MTQNQQFIITIITSLLGSGVLLGVFQHFSTRRARREDAARKKRQDSQDQKERQLKQERQELAEAQKLATAQAQTQLSALHSEDTRYRRVTKENKAIRHGMVELANGLAIIIDAFESHLTRFRLSRNGETYSATVQAADMIEAKKAISEARKHLTPGMMLWDDDDEDIDE